MVFGWTEVRPLLSTSHRAAQGLGLGLPEGQASSEPLFDLAAELCREVRYSVSRSGLSWVRLQASRRKVSPSRLGGVWSYVLGKVPAGLHLRFQRRWPGWR